MDFPNYRSHPILASISSWTRYSSQSELHLATPAAITWVANLAIYVPVTFPVPYPVRRMFWCNGTTADANVDVGVYTTGGTRLYSSGSTAQSGTSSLQYVSLSSELVLHGRCYLAFACSSASASRTVGLSGGGTSLLRLAGVLQESSAFPLPSSWTPEAISNDKYPFVGVTHYASGF